MEIDSPGVYTVTVSNVCESVVDTVLVLDKLTADEIFQMPNTITPNGDLVERSSQPVMIPNLKVK
ncbi:MAG: hypothetical protein IPJ60_00015 [Sphingobacteriaceae bacterium]|nr:hypothetical protein [Sphingobacteriaceae bacterium]